MKFYVVVNYYLESLSFKFYEDPCINAHKQVGLSSPQAGFKIIMLRLAMEFREVVMVAAENFIKIRASVAEIFTKQF